jgi:hypothetical protein
LIFKEEIKMAKELMSFEGRRFKYATNFSGDPTKDKYHESNRKGNLLITQDEAKRLESMGFNVKMTKPVEGKESEYNPEWYIKIIVKFGENETLWPKVYLLSGDNEPKKLGPDTIGMIDDIWVGNVDVVCAPYEYEPGKFTLYVRFMYVTQNVDDDPYYAKYFKKGETE